MCCLSGPLPLLCKSLSCHWDVCLLPLTACCYQSSCVGTVFTMWCIPILQKGVMFTYIVHVCMYQVNSMMSKAMLVQLLWSLPVLYPATDGLGWERNVEWHALVTLVPGVKRSFPTLPFPPSHLISDYRSTIIVFKVHLRLWNNFFRW